MCDHEFPFFLRMQSPLLIVFFLLYRHAKVTTGVHDTIRATKAMIASGESIENRY